MKQVNRRAMLRGLGGVLLALPALEACSKNDAARAGQREQVGSQSSALVAKPARRFIAMMRPNGVDPPLWFPTGGETDFVLAPQSAAFEAVRQHLILTYGVDNRVALDQAAAGNGNGHIEGVMSLLTGHGAREEPKGTNTWKPLGGPSIDQTLSDFHVQNGYLGRARAIYLGEQGVGLGYSGVSVRQDLTGEEVFADFGVLFDSNKPTTDAARENARLTKKSILDGVKADFTSLSARISGEDKRRIDAHLEALRSIELRLDVVSNVQCKAPTTADPTNDDERRELYNDIVVASFACDATRVAALSFYHSGGGGPQLPHLGVLEDIHELSHQVWDHHDDAGHPSHALFTKYHDWFTQKTVSLVQKLKAVKTPEGTLFDDTVLFQGSELAVNHACPNMPFVILAGDSTPFKTGRFLRFPAETMHTHLLTSLLNAFNHPATQVGDPKYPSGNLNSVLFG